MPKRRGLPYNLANPIVSTQEIVQSTTTSATFKPSAQTSDAARVLRDIFEATPLYIFWTAAKQALQQSAR